MNRSLKNLIVYVLALAVAGVLWYIYWQRDRSIMEHGYRWHNTMDSLAMHYTDHEIRVAKKFSDTTLPGLMKKGLIIKYDRRQVETVVTVSGKIWKNRSPFFKESFLTQMMIHNRVRGYPTAVKIVDQRSSRLYAQITTSEQKIIYE